MRILQIVDPRASEFDKKCQRIDFAAFSEKHEVIVRELVRDAPDADIAHIYGSSSARGLKVPYVSSSQREKRWLEPKPVAIATLDTVPEAVEDAYRMEKSEAPRPEAPRPDGRWTIGSYNRASTRNIIEQTLARIHRFRDDIEWKLFDHAPSRGDLMRVDAWIDPAVDENDYDGFVAEALVVENIVVASRIAINSQRLEQGRTGFLVPRNDPNELTHAILAALFKPEVAHSKMNAARQTVGKFQPRQRTRVLERLYETVIR